MKTAEEVLIEALGKTRYYLNGSITNEQLIWALETYADQYRETEVKNLAQPDVTRCFAIRKVRVTKARFEKNGYGIAVTDLSNNWKYLHMISIQLFFKTGLAILYELHDKKQSCV